VEAATVRAAATDLLGRGKERRLVVLGDLNDVPEAATTQIPARPPGSEIGTGGFNQPDRGDGQRLWNLAPTGPGPHPTTERAFDPDRLPTTGIGKSNHQLCPSGPRPRSHRPRCRSGRWTIRASASRPAPSATTLTAAAQKRAASRAADAAPAPRQRRHERFPRPDRTTGHPVGWSRRRP